MVSYVYFSGLVLITDGFNLSCSNKPLNVIWIFSETEQNFQQRDKVLPVFKHGFFRSEENVDINNFIHRRVYQ